MRNFRRRAIPLVAALGMEGCWLFALLAVARSLMEQGNVSLPYLFSLYPISLALNWGLSHLPWKRRYFIALNVLLGLLAALILTKALLYPGYSILATSWWLDWSKSLAQPFLNAQFTAGWLVLGGAGLLWWRGLSLARGKLDFPRLATRFQFGAGILLLVLFFAGGHERAELPGASQYVTVFFFFALVGLAAARAEESPGKGLLGHHRLWLSAIAIACVLLAGIIIGNYVTQDFLRLLAKPFIMLGHIIVVIMTWLASLFHSSSAPPPEVLAPTPFPETPPDDVRNLFQIPEVVRKIGGAITIAITLGLLLMALYRLSEQVWQWLRQMMPTTPQANLESLPGAWKADLKGLLLYLLSWLLGIPLWRRLLKAARGSFHAGERLSPTRQLYVNLQRWAASGGYPRHPQQTPLEFSRVLQAALPEGREDLTLITEAYLQARYGQTAPAIPYHRLEEGFQRLRHLKLSPGSEVT